jgi:hypothetical protein
LTPPLQISNSMLSCAIAPVLWRAGARGEMAPPAQKTSFIKLNAEEKMSSALEWSFDSKPPLRQKLCTSSSDHVGRAYFKPTTLQVKMGSGGEKSNGARSGGGSGAQRQDLEGTKCTVQAVMKGSIRLIIFPRRPCAPKVKRGSCTWSSGTNLSIDRLALWARSLAQVA